FLRATPRWTKQIKGIHSREDVSLIAGSVLAVVAKIAADDGESALGAFRSSPQALRTASLSQFEAWAEKGMTEFADQPAKARRSYFALETRESNAFLRSEETGLLLDSINSILRMYIEGMTGKEVEIAAFSA